MPEGLPPVKQPSVAGTIGAATQPDSEEKEAAPAPNVCDKIPIGREVKRKLPDLPFEDKYGGGEDYYVRECYKEYYPLVEQFVLTEESCLTVTGTTDIGKSVFYAYVFEEFWKAHRDEWIVVAVSYERNGSVSGFAVFEDGIGTKRYRFGGARGFTASSTV
ncbi:hypothetical protein PF008_g26529 [Phytophthora fragariae]|uniref:Uncharacterized protein n=1 Tax=Phytophthora fragariae TaxID=53985 RepID=A0A6G0QGT1_9STRA|nr:hypothetical protein PF008_g26529 [Phytophthora fragariae]